MFHFKKSQDFASNVGQYAADSMNLRTLLSAADELIRNPEKYSLSEKSTVNNQPSIILRGSDGEKYKFFTDKETKKDFEKAGLTNDGVLLRTSMTNT